MTIRVKHLITYLQTHDPECEVLLDKDGWMENDTGKENPTEQDIIMARGLFTPFEDVLYINN